MFRVNLKITKVDDKIISTKSTHKNKIYSNNKQSKTLAGKFGNALT